MTGNESDIVTFNYYQYYKAFAMSGIINYHEGPVSWINPKKGEKGPSLAFDVKLDEITAEKEIKAIITGICAKNIPNLWILTPDATPRNIVAILEKNGFRNLSSEASEPELGMLLNRNDFEPYSSSEVRCRKVQSKKDFRLWIDVVNTALHGWEMIDAEHYYVWVEKENINIYLGEINGIPVSTVATIQTKDVASIEFTSTLQEYRCRGAAATLCSKALADLFTNDVKAVTLSGAPEAVALYQKLGFHSCFHNILMRYDIPEK